MPKLAKTSDPPTPHRWPRFSHYTLTGGYITPARCAKLTLHDPWAAYASARRASTTVTVAYDELIDLVDHVTVRIPDAAEIDRLKRQPSQKAGSLLRPTLTTYEFDERALLAWVHKYGLLGLLHHRLEAVHMYADGVPTSMMTWARGAWRTLSLVLDRPEFIARYRASAAEFGQVNSTYAIVRPVSTPGAEARMACAGWDSYFPSASDSQLLSVPDLLADGRAWAVYAEPIDEFLNAAIALRTMLVALRDPKRRGFDANDGLLYLEELLAPVRRTVRVGAGGKLEPTWASPSLIGTIGAMVFEDITREGRVATCA